MKKILIFVPIVFTLMIAACSPAAPQTQESGNMPMENNAMLTATPGSMMAENPKASHMMDPVNANFSMTGHWKLTVYVRNDAGLDYKEDIDFKVQ